jgi:G3E family GTPase
VNLIIVAGFLGAGKTTLLLKITSDLVSLKRMRVAIIENEIGQIGIDNQYLELEGLKVQQLQSGCICCALSSDLITTLDQLQKSYHPDVVILEPSGVANAAKILEVIDRSPLGISERKVIVLVDATRFRAIMAITFPFVQDSLNVADIVVVNKIDGVDRRATEEITKEVECLTGTAKVLKISATQGTGLKELMREVC